MIFCLCFNISKLTPHTKNRGASVLTVTAIKLIKLENGFELKHQQQQASTTTLSTAISTDTNLGGGDGHGIGGNRKGDDVISIKSETSAQFKRDKLIKIAKLLEAVSFTSLPLLFLIFNLIYWPWLFVSAGK